MTAAATTPGPASRTRAGTDRAGIAVAVGAVFWLVATVQYFVAQGVAAAAWAPPYRWARNYIRDLGNTACGPFAVPHGTASYVCSPRHALMNSSFITSGVLFVLGAVLLRRLSLGLEPRRVHDRADRTGRHPVVDPRPVRRDVVFSRARSGGMERVASYPASIWNVAVAAGALMGEGAFR